MSKIMAILAFPTLAVMLIVAVYSLFRTDVEPRLDLANIKAKRLHDSLYFDPAAVMLPDARYGGRDSTANDTPLSLMTVSYVYQPITQGMVIKESDVGCWLHVADESACWIVRRMQTGSPTQ